MSHPEYVEGAVVIVHVPFPLELFDGLIQIAEGREVEFEALLSEGVNVLRFQIAASTEQINSLKEEHPELSGQMQLFQEAEEEAERQMQTYRANPPHETMTWGFAMPEEVATDMGGVARRLGGESESAADFIIRARFFIQALYPPTQS